MKLKISLQAFFLVSTSVLIFSIGQAAQDEDNLYPCKNRKTINQSTLCQYEIKTDRGSKIINALNLKGDAYQTSYDHGFLLAAEIEAGAVKVTTDITRANLNSGGAAQRGAVQILAQCLTDRMKKSASEELKKSVEGMYRGYKDRLQEKAKYNEEDFFNGILGIELANLAEGILRKADESGLDTVSELMGLCGIGLPIEILFGAIGQIGKNAPKLGGCIGFSVPENLAFGAALHARNLDIDMVSGWNVAPTVFFVEHIGKKKFVGSSAAGMMFPGGVGGMNEDGLAISLHQMSTTKYNAGFKSGVGLLAPEMTQKILEEASSIDDAINLVENTQRYAAWTVFITDTKTKEIASIEFSGDKVNSSRKLKNTFAGQTNHFLAPEMKDQAFTYNFNKYFESLSRLTYIESQMSQLSTQNQASVKWAIDRLSGHHEVVPDNDHPYSAFKSFGKTATKAYTVMSVVMRPEIGEYWSTVGELFPASHSTFVGFKVDFKQNRIFPFQQQRTQQYKNMPNWELSLEEYVKARQAYVSYIENNPEKSLSHLNKAIELAAKDGISELPYYFMRARLQHELGLKQKNKIERKNYLEAALSDWNFLWNRRLADWKSSQKPTDDFYYYGRALIALYKVATLDQLDPRTDRPKKLPPHHKTNIPRELPILASSKERIELLQEAAQTLNELKTVHNHFDLKAKLDLLKEMKNPTRYVSLPSLDFVVVDQ